MPLLLLAVLSNLDYVPHLRKRHLLEILLKRRKLWPVLGVLGPRQVGKSTLLRDLLSPLIEAEYVTLDHKEDRGRAIRAPGNFLGSVSQNLTIPVVIDEVQKASELFDAVKAEVDRKRIPGRFFLSGSTEFSKKTGVYESLTGRIGLTHLYPFTLAELRSDKLRTPWVDGKLIQPSSPSELERWIQRGGMPGMCFLRVEEERRAAYEAWIETTCFRDLQQIRDRRLEGELAKDILYQLASLERPILSEVAYRLKQDARKIKRHMEALEALFVLHRLPPHSLGVGKDQYLFFDAGLGRFLGISRIMALRIWALNECLAQYEYQGIGKPKITYYESSKRSFIDMVVDNRKNVRAVAITEDATPGTYALRPLLAFQKKQPNTLGLILAPIHSPIKESKTITFLPWTVMG